MGDTNTGIVKDHLILSLLSYLKSFGEFEEEAVGDLIAALKPFHYKKDQVLLSVGEMCQTAFFIDKGIVKFSFVNDKGLENVVSFQQGPCFFSDINSMLNGSVCKETISMMNSGIGVSIEWDKIRKLNDKYHKLSQVHTKILEKITCGYREQQYFHLENSLEQRYIKFRQQLPGLEDKVPAYLIASYLKCTPESFSRMKKRLLTNNKKVSYLSPINPPDSSSIKTKCN